MHPIDRIVSHRRREPGPTLATVHRRGSGHGPSTARRRRPGSALPLLLCAALVALGAATGAAAQPWGDAAAAEVAAARAVFEANLEAIANRDRDAYLATYLEADTLARTGPEGFTLGYEDFAAQAGGGWPEVFEAQDLSLVPVEPGVVYGTYRYRVVYPPEEPGAVPLEATGLSERLFVETPDGWKIAVTTAFEAPPGTPPPPRALVGATLLDGTGARPVPDAVVLLAGGEIECAGSREECSVPEGVGTVDLSGRYLTPGLVDAHVHFSQTGWADGRPDATDVRDRYPYPEVIADLAAHPERFFRAHLCSGVTAVFDVGGYPWTLELSERAERDTLAPHVAAAGPLLTTLDHWLNLPAERQFHYLDEAEAAVEGVRYLAARGADAVKVWFIANRDREMEEMAALVRAAGAEADRLGLPLIVHATGLAEAKEALRAGAEVLVHSVEDQAVDEEFLELARAAGTVYTPTLTVRAGYGRMFTAAATGDPPEVDDPHGCVDPGTLAKVAESVTLPPRLEGEQLAAWRERLAAGARTMAANLVAVHRAGIPVAMGTDAGNPLTLHGPAVYAELEAMEAAGLMPAEVLIAATAGGALALGRSEDLGTLEPGKAADLLVLAEDPTASASAFRSLTHVVRGGVLRGVEELARRPTIGLE